MTAASRHTPVMLERCVDLLAPALAGPGSLAIDGTLGMGGHTEALLTACPQARVVGIDRDAQAIALASERLDGAGVTRLRPWREALEQYLNAKGLIETGRQEPIADSQ